MISLKTTFHGIKSNIKNNLIPGIIVVVPLVITIIVLKWLFNFFDELVQPFIEHYIHIYIPGLGLLISVAFIYLVGLLTKNFFGNKLIQLGEWIVIRIPVAKTVYSSVKQIMTSLTIGEKKRSPKVVLIEYPAKGIYSLGLLNGETWDEHAHQKLASILIITSINPTSGFTVLLPFSEVRQTDLAVEQLMKFVVSGGIVVPEKFQSKNMVPE
ncbi:MAG: DUF502 domain-containing protein [bacterium]|nr:MAG: DUF502 domain-containing protein [bacterium]